jgi:hypothetical protein
VDCDPDTIQPLLQTGVVREESRQFSLSQAGGFILATCLVANRRWRGEDMRVDYPQAFVIMPFSEAWSDQVYNEMIKPAVEAAGLVCVRGDSPVRVGDLMGTIWDALMEAGIMIADVSAPNVNVFYELGLTHALGKDTFILKRRDAKIAADFGGAHYYEYDLANLAAGKEMLRAALIEWANKNKAMQVKTILGR